MKKNKQLHKPYCNNIRPFKSDSRSDYYSNSFLSYAGEDAYSPGLGGVNFVRAFNILQQEMFKIFEFVEPSDENLKCYSLQIHSLIIKTCIELEANFRTILRNNG